MLRLLISDSDVLEWLSLGLLASARALRQSWESNRLLLARAQAWLVAVPRRPETDPILPYGILTDRFNSKPAAPPAYSPFTHYGVRPLRNAMMEMDGLTVVVTEVMVEWRRDHDGRVRELHELNLTHLNTRVFRAEPIPAEGGRHLAVLTLLAGPLRERFFSKD